MIDDRQLAPGEARLLRASWFGSDLLVALIALGDDADDPQRLRLIAHDEGGGEIGLDARWHHLPAEIVERSDEAPEPIAPEPAAGAGGDDDDDGGDGGDGEPDAPPPADEPVRTLEPIEAAWLVTIVAPPGTPAVEALSVERGGERVTLAPDHLAAVLCSSDELAQTMLAVRPPATRTAALGFVLSAPSRHGVESGPGIAEHLAMFHERLRERLPVTDIGPGIDCALRLERVYAIDERSFWLSGWIHDASPRDGRLSVITPEGVRVTPLPGAVSFHPRRDVSRVFGPGDPAPSLGFHLYVELDAPSYGVAGWLVELRTPEGDAVEDTARHPVGDNREEVRRRLMEPLKSERADPAILADQVLPALRRLRIGGHVAIDRIADYGRPPAAPVVSIVIAVRHIDRIEHQLTQFARDPELARAELIYVTPPGASAALRRRAPQWHELFRLPIRVVELSEGARRPRAINLGASVARGRLLVLLSGDVFPIAPGWLGQLRDAHDTIPDAGIVAPRLLHPDGSIAHAGARYERDPEAERWMRMLPLRGLSATIPAARGARRVQAVSPECLVISADRFRAHDGLSELYFDGADETGELCLRLAEDRLQTWQADVSMYWLERAKSWPQTAAAAPGRFNDWLLDRRWGARLTAAAPVAGQPAVTFHEPGALAVPQVGSGRPGAPVEITKVTMAQPDESWVLDAALLRPRPDTEWESYAGTYAFTVQGWAVARDGAPVTVELRDGQRPIGHAVTRLRRQDVFDRYPDAPGADASGFQTVVGSLGLAQAFQVQVDLVAEDGRRTLLARIDGRRRPVRSSYAPALQPALITTLGRTGSSWLALLLSMHPKIVAYRPFQNEARVGSYWMEVLRTLAQPSSYIQTLRPELYQGHWWIGDERPSPLPLQLAEPHMPRWLGGENVEVVAGFCQSRLDAFYSELARVQEPDHPRYFAEKAWPDEITPQLLGELYPEGREILLVRDFRDMVCSILGFNAKRGFASFGREVTESDEEFIRYLRVSAQRMLDSWVARRETSFLVRYEDLILHPEATLAEAFAYLDIEADPGTVSRTIADAEALLPHVQRAHQTSTSVAASVGRWRHELSPDLQAICHETFGDILDAFGYEPTPQTSSSERSATISNTASGMNPASS